MTKATYGQQMFSISDARGLLELLYKDIKIWIGLIWKIIILNIDRAEAWWLVG